MKRTFAVLASVAALVTACASEPAVVQAPPRPYVSELLRATAVVTHDHALCSGVWLDDLMLLTASHCVVDDEFQAVPVQITQDGVHSVPSALVDLDTSHDLALLVVPQAPAHASVWIAESTPAVGADVWAVGHPWGDNWSLTRGIVSAYRPVDYLSEYFDGPWLQVSPYVAQPGNSGGGLFNAYGQLVGICSLGDRRSHFDYFVTLGTIRVFLERPHPHTMRGAHS